MEKFASQQQPYDIFVSYSRDPDYRLARRLTSFLESFYEKLGKEREQKYSPLKVCLDGVTFSLPPKEKKSDTDDGPSLGRSVNPVVESYLSQSRELLMLCSNNYRDSHWANHEIAWWLEHRGADSIRVAVTEGSYPWGEPEAFFPAAVTEAGLHQTINYDFRGFYKKKAKSWRKVNEFDSERVRLAADLKGESSGKILPLWQRDQLRLQRRRFRITTAVVVVIIATLLTAGYQMMLRANAEAHSIEQQASRLVAEAFEVVERKPAMALMMAHRARSLHDSEQARTAIESAYRVLIFHAINRRESGQITGTGPAYLAARFKEGNLFTVFSDDGRYALIASGRESGGAGKQPGDVFVVNNETLRTIELSAPESAGFRGRVEYLGFDRDNQRIFVTRQFNLAIFELDGSYVGGFKFSRFTKSPIHLVAGFLNDKFVLGADSKGGVWLVDPNGDETHTLQREWHGDPLLWADVNASGNRISMVFESGRAGVISLEDLDGDQRIKDVVSKDTLYAGFPTHEDQLFVAGENGLLQSWRFPTGSLPVRDKSYTSAEGDIDWVSMSPNGVLLTLGRENEVSLLDAERDILLDRLQLTDKIDWAAMRRLPGHVDPPIGEYITVGNRQWLATRGGAYLVEKDRLIPMTNSFLKIREIVELAGTTWILTGDDGLFASPSPLLRVDGYMTFPAPDELGVVYTVAESGEHVFFATSTGVWRWGPEGYQAIRGIDRALDKIDARGTDIWAISQNFVLRPSPAFRIDGLKATPFPIEKSIVHGLVFGPDAVWLNTGTIEAPGPAYRVVGDVAETVPNDLTPTDIVKLIQNDVWLWNYSYRTPAGPAYRWSDGKLAVFPSVNTNVVGVFDIKGEIWLLYHQGTPPVGYAARLVDNDVISFELGNAKPKLISKLGEDIWVSTDKGAFRLDANKLIRIPDLVFDVDDIQAVGDTVWITGSGVAYAAEGDQVIAFDTEGRTVRDIVRVNETTWLLFSGEYSQPGPAYRVENQNLFPFRNSATNVADIRDQGDKTLVTVMNADFTTEVFTIDN
jgi:hypothetical protein